MILGSSSASLLLSDAFSTNVRSTRMRNALRRNAPPDSTGKCRNMLVPRKTTASLPRHRGAAIYSKLVSASSQCRRSSLEPGVSVALIARIIHAYDGDLHTCVYSICRRKTNSRAAAAATIRVKRSSSSLTSNSLRADGPACFLMHSIRQTAIYNKRCSWPCAWAHKHLTTRLARNSGPSGPYGFS